MAYGDKARTPLNPNKTVAVPFPANLKRMKATEVADAWGLNMVLFGVPGTGKTTLASTAQDSPYGADVIFIDVEGGTRAISDRYDIDVVNPTSTKEIHDLYTWLNRSNDHTYRTIVIDTLAELQRMGMKEIMETAKNPEFPGIQDWGRSTEQMIRLVRAFRNLAQTRGWNVIFTAHANEQKDEVTGGIFTRPNLTPKATEMVCGAVDVVGYLTREKDGSRLLRLEPTNTIVAKYRQPRTGPQLPTLIKDPSLVTMLGHLRNEAQFSEPELDTNISATSSATITSTEMLTHPNTEDS